jgi:hypothetical protein
MYKLCSNSEFIFYKLLKSCPSIKRVLSTLIIRLINKTNYILIHKNNIILREKNKQIKTNPLLLIKIFNSLWKIKYISKRGFIYLDNPRDKKEALTYYNRINIFILKNNILQGIIVPNKKKIIKIDLGVRSRSEVFSLGVNYNSFIGMQDNFSVVNSKYLISNNISNTIGLLLLIEVEKFLFKKNLLNFLLYKDFLFKILIIKDKIKIRLLLNNSKEIGIIVLSESRLNKFYGFCKKLSIFLGKDKLKPKNYFVSLVVKYLNTQSEMIYKKDIERLIKLIIWTANYLYY